MLLFRVVSTPGVRKSLCLSVHFSTEPASGGQHPRPLGVTSALHPLCIGQTPPHLFHVTCTSAIPHRSSSFITHPSPFLLHPPCLSPKKKKKCYHFVTSLLLELWKPLCFRPFRHLRSNPTRILTLFFDRLSAFIRLTFDRLSANFATFPQLRASVSPSASVPCASPLSPHLWNTASLCLCSCLLWPCISF